MSVSATKPETSTAPASVSANSMNNLPVRPVANANGAYTATSVSVMATTGNAISRMPINDASRRDFPSSIWRYMFSNTTIASSTTRPMASTMANKVRVLTENPNKYIMPNAPMSETGIVTIGIRLARTLRRKKKITSTTRTSASRMV